MCRKGYKIVSLGFITALINFRFGIINISYIIGYFLIGYGISLIQVEYNSKDFKTVNYLANILFIGSIFVPVLVYLVSHIDEKYIFVDVYITILSICHYAIKFVMIFFIFSGTNNIFIEKQFIYESDKLEKVQRFYVISNILCLVLLSISINISEKRFSYFITILLMIIELYFIIILYKIYKRIV